MRIVTAREIKAIDRYAIKEMGIPAEVLMESAGRSVFAEIVRSHPNLQKKKCGVICGVGNNGGDGFVIARYLWMAQADVDVWVVGNSEPKGAALTHFSVLQKLGVNLVRIRSSKDFSSLRHPNMDWDFVVDALVGIGLDRPLGDVFASVVDLVQRRKTANSFQVYSVDIPSGLEADTGKVLGKALQADVTVTFGFKKVGFFLNQGPEFCGEIRVANISLDDRWADSVQARRLFETEPEEIRSWIKPRKKQSHKGTYGHVLVLAGSPQKSGAAVLASVSALRVGAGLCTLALPASAHNIVKSQLVEVMTESLPDDGKGRILTEGMAQLLDLCKGKRSLVVGPGLIPSPSLRTLLTQLFRSVEIPVLLDADGLNVFGTELLNLGKNVLRKMVLTPHPGEMSKLLGTSVEEISSNRVQIARDFSDRSQSIVVLKGAFTIVALPGGETFINPTGNPSMATAGMGDVLSGIIGGMMAQGLTPEQASVAGVFYHGWAGDRVALRQGSQGVLARDVMNELPRLFR